MKLFFINSFDTEISETREGDLLRASLLFADKIIIGSRLTVILLIEDFLQNGSEEFRLSMLKILMPQVFLNYPDLKESFEPYVKRYLQLKAAKNKSQDEIIQFLRLKNFIDLCQTAVIELQKGIANEMKVDDLIPFCGHKKEIEDEPIVMNEKLTIETLKKYVFSDDSLFLLDKEVFNHSIGIQKDGTNKIDEVKFKNEKNLYFLYEEILSVPLLADFPLEYFKIVKNNLLKGTTEFNKTISQEKERIEATAFNKDNFDVIVNVLQSINKKLSMFEKIEKENILLNEWQTGKSAFKRARILAAVTSIEKLILIMERLKILKERERLYLLNKISGKRNLQNGILFLIAD